MKLPKNINAALVTTPLSLSAQELNALERVIALAWEAVQHQTPVGDRPGSPDQRSVWAAGRALRKIRIHLKGL